MTLRRYTPIAKSRGTVIPAELRAQVMERDGVCVGPLVGMPGLCDGPLDLDHIRSSGALGKKSRTTLDNLVALCRFQHHALKTREGRTWRPRLIEFVEFMASRVNHEAHVDPCGPDCRAAVPV